VKWLKKNLDLNKKETPEGMDALQCNSDQGSPTQKRGRTQIYHLPWEEKKDGKEHRLWKCLKGKESPILRRFPFLENACEKKQKKKKNSWELNPIFLARKPNSSNRQCERKTWGLLAHKKQR